MPANRGTHLTYLLTRFVEFIAPFSMATLVIPGIPHHVTQRGNCRHRQQTFFNDGDSVAYLELMTDLCLNEGVAICTAALARPRESPVLAQSCRRVGEESLRSERAGFRPVPVGAWYEYDRCCRTPPWPEKPWPRQCRAHDRVSVLHHHARIDRRGGISGCSVDRDRRAVLYQSHFGVESHGEPRKGVGSLWESFEGEQGQAGTMHLGLAKKGL